MFGQDTTKTSKTSADADIFQRLIQNIDSTGITKFGLIVGADTTFLIWDGVEFKITDDITALKSITISSADSVKEGTIEWDGTNFRGYDGAAWSNLDNVFVDSVTYAYYLNNTGIGVDSTRYQLNVSGTANALEYKAKKNEWQALVSFSWDDGTEWEYSIMLPLFNAKGEVATANIVTDWIGDANRMTWDEVRALQTAGWEIGSHSLDHKRLSTLSIDSVIIEFKHSLAKLELEGLNVTSFTYPHNDAGGYALDYVSDYYRCARSSYVNANNTDTLNDNVLRSYCLTSMESDDHTQIATYKRLIDRAQDENAWLILYAHQPDSDDSTMVAELIDYIQAKGDTVDIVTISQGMNLIGNQVDLSDDFAVNNENIRLNGSIYRYMFPFLHTYADTAANGYNLFMGVQSGNTSSSPDGGAATLASKNTGVGKLVLNSLTTGYRNSAFGNDALQYNTTGHSNSAIGVGALWNNTAGNMNVAVGYHSVYSNTIGDDNIGIGYNALYHNTGAYNNNIAIGTASLFGVSGSTNTSNSIAIGYHALNGITTGINNVSIGYESGKVNTTGGANIFIGSLAGDANTIGDGSVFVGTSAGSNNTEGDNNVAVGQNAMLSNTTGTTNTAVGFNSIYSNTSGNHNTGIGKSTLYNFTADYNVAIGTLSLFGVSGSSTGNNVVGIGYKTGQYNTVGNNSTYIGSLAGSNGNPLSGTDNVFIGYKSGFESTTCRRSVCVGTSAGQNSTTGRQNTYIGHTSGMLNNGSDNVFIGYTCGSAATGISNQLWLDNSNTETPLIYAEFDNDLFKINGTHVQATGTITDNDATPDVSAVNILTYAGSANSVTVTDLDNPQPGAIYYIIGNSATYTITIQDSGNFNLNTSDGNWVGSVDDVLVLLCVADNSYIEISRSINVNP